METGTARPSAFGAGGARAGTGPGPMLPQAASACSRVTVVVGAPETSLFTTKSKWMRANGLLRPALWISRASVTRSTRGISSSRVPKAKSSCRYLSPSILIWVVSLR